MATRAPAAAAFQQRRPDRSIGYKAPSKFHLFVKALFFAVRISAARARPRASARNLLPPTPPHLFTHAAHGNNKVLAV